MSVERKKQVIENQNSSLYQFKKHSKQANTNATANNKNQQKRKQQSYSAQTLTETDSFHVTHNIVGQQQQQEQSITTDKSDSVFSDVDEFQTVKNDSNMNIKIHVEAEWKPGDN